MIGESGPLSNPHTPTCGQVRGVHGWWAHHLAHLPRSSFSHDHERRPVGRVGMTRVRYVAHVRGMARRSASARPSAGVRIPRSRSGEATQNQTLSRLMPRTT
jgi:hypothetical protein